MILSHCILKVEMSEKKEFEPCIVQGCIAKKHGLFDECKSHFRLRHKEGQRFKWFPGNIGYITLMKILLCYQNRVCSSLIKEEHIDRGAYSNIPLVCLICEYQWSPTINDLINS